MSALVFGFSVACLVGCGPKPPASGALPGSEENATSHRVPGAGVEFLSQPGSPSLQLVRREGDPAGALAVAVFPPGGSAGALQMASLVKSRLDARGLKHHLQVHGIGFILVRDATRPAEVKSWFAAVHKALHESVTKEDLKRLGSIPLLQAAAKRADALSPFGLCLGELGAEGSDALSEAVGLLRSESYADFLEELRMETAVASRVGFSALGSAALLDAAQAASRRKWPAGEPLDDSWTSESQRAVVESRGAREIRLALRVADSEAALAGARSLQDPSHPLHARLHALDPRLDATDIRVTLRPAGACVGLSVAFDSESQLPIRRIAAASLLAQDELQQAVHQSYANDDETLAILSPQGAREAAALAAWTAVRSTRIGGRHKEILEYRGTESPAITHQALDRSVEELAAEWAKRSIPTVTRNESGQAEVWALLASPCGTLPESAEEAGLRSLTVSALAQDWGLRHGVRLEPWLSPTGIGIVAHSPALRGESVAQHATRVVRALGSSFYGSPLDGRTLAAVRADLLERLGEDPGLEVVTAILGAGRPSFANPLGTSKTMATFSVADAERTRADLAQEPLRLAFLANASLAQGSAASEALTHWLAPTRDHVTDCAVPTETPPPPGTWDIETVDENVGTSAYVAVFSPSARPVGEATAYLLNRRGGYLERAFSDPGLVAQAEARVLGSALFGGLYLRVTSDEGQLEAATQQARAVLAALAVQGIPAEDASAAEKMHRSLDAAVLRTQRGRLIQLFEATRKDLPASPKKLSLRALREFHRKLDGPEHRVVTVRRRK